MVSGTVLTGSDAVEITVTNNDPALLLTIANAWGRHFVDYVNNLYASGSFQGTLLNIQRQANDARAKFLDAEQAYIAFLGLSPLEEYTRIREELIRVDRLLIDARGLLEQVENGGEGAATSNALSVSILKIQVFASHTSTDTSQLQANPITLQFQANPGLISSQDLIVDIKSLVTTLENRSQALLERVNFLVEQQQNQSEFSSVETIQSLDNAASVTVEDIIRLLTSRIEYEQGRTLDLVLARDLAWNAYQNLATKEAELIIASQTGGQEVVLGSTARVTQNGSSLIRDVALAAIVGLVVSVFVAFAIEFWWGYKGREPMALLGREFWGKVGTGGSRQGN
jgi:hypothetical protein